MNVYVEYVFADNFVIDLLLFRTAFKITGKTVSRKRLLLCSLTGGAFALLYPLITRNAVIISLVKILFGLLLTFCAARFTSVKDYLAFTAVFFGLTFAVGGAVIGAFSLLGIDYSSETSVALMVFPVYGLIRGANAVIRLIYRKRDVSHLTARTEIRSGGTTVSANGFFDTGNALYDGLSPVILVNERTVKPLLGLNLIKRAKYITVKTAVGTDKKISFKPDSLVIYYGNERHIFNNVTVCVVDSTGEYDVVLHPALMETENETKFAVKIKEVS